MSMNFGNNSFHENEHMLHSLPAALQTLINQGSELNENMMPITTQNYVERYKDLEGNYEELKTYYKKLKADHTRQKNEYLDMKAQMTSLIEENKMMQEKYKAMFEKMQQESRRKQLIIEELKNKELDEIKLERLKDELSQQIEAPYKDIVKQLEVELQKIQQEYNRVKFEIEFLKSVNEHDKEEHANHLDQMKVKHDVEMNALRKDRDILREKLQETNKVEISKMKEVIRENNQLKIKLKSLMEENDEIREKLEHSETQNNSLIRNHSRVLSEFTTKISILESEKDSLRQQTENSHREVVDLIESSAESVRRLHDVERENTKLKLSVEDLQNQSQKDLAKSKLDHVKLIGEENRVKEKLRAEIEDLKLKLEIANESVALHRSLVDDKEREIAQTINRINEENWTKINELTNEKIESDSKFQINSKDFELKLNALQIDKDKSDDRLKAFEKQREDLVKENAHLRSLVLDSENMRSELEKEQEKNRDLYRKLHKAETELNTNTSMEQELTEINMRLKSEISFHQQEVQRAREHTSRMRDEFENRFNEWKSQFMAEKNEYKFRCEDTETKLARANAKLADVQKFHEKKKKQYQTFSKSLKTKAEALNAKVRELKAKESYSSKSSVPVEAYNKLKTQLRTIGKKHLLFREMILAGNLNSSDQMASFSKLSSVMSMPVFSSLEANENLTGHFSVYGNENLKKKDTSGSFSKSETTKLELTKKFDEITNRLDFLATIQSGHISGKEQNTSNNVSINVSDKKLSASPSRKETPQKLQTSVLEESENRSKRADVKQIEVKKLSMSSSSTSSVESLSKKLEKSALMSPDDEKIVYANMSRTSTPEKDTARKDSKVKEKQQTIVIKKPTYSSSSSDDEDF